MVVKRPKSVRIGALRYKLRDDTIRRDLGQRQLGQLTRRNQIIHIALQARGQECDTIIHESLHEMIRQSAYFDHELEEGFVLTLAPKLLEFILDNPKLIRYIQANGGKR